GQDRGNDSKKTIISANEAPKYYRDKDKFNKKVEKVLNTLDRNVITPENTKLELIQIFIPKRSIGDGECMGIVNNMRELRKDELFCFDHEIKHPRSNRLRQRNTPILFKVLTTFDWIGPLNCIPVEDYQLHNCKGPCFKRKTKKAVEKHIGEKYLLFASPEHRDLAKRPHKRIHMSELDSVKTPLGEERFGWRLTIGGICIGIIPAAANYVDLGTEDWGKDRKKIFSPIARGFGKFTRWFARQCDKAELGWFD
ncbi:MAG: hypothetical protein ACFFD1_15265, partial [Candidatus Thorarchaeota archaeon]